MSSATYAERLLDPRWQKRRLEIFQRDLFTCQHCGATDKTLSVHHHFYIAKRPPWDQPAWSMITLCDHRHKAEQSKNPNDFEQDLGCAIGSARGLIGLCEIISAAEDWALHGLPADSLLEIISMNVLGKNPDVLITEETP